MASQAAALLAGVDTLILNAKQPQRAKGHEHEQDSSSQEGGLSDLVSEELVNELNCWLDKAKNAGEPVPTPWVHENITLMISPHGTPTHRYLLKNGWIDLLIGPQLHNGAPARVRFSSEYLWRRGVDTALVNTHMFLWSLFQQDMDLQPSEIHVCADMAGLHIPRHYERVFVSRAAKWRPVKESQLDKPIYRYHRLETLQFSGHGSPVSVTIYNKRAEIEQKSRDKVWFYDLWKKHGWDGEAPVWRVECRLKREALHEMDIDETYQALDQVPALWSYCVGHPGQTDGWVRMVEPNRQDSNRWRWKTTRAWETVQKAFLGTWRDAEDAEEIQRQRKRQINLDRAEKAIAGYTTTYAAWLQDEVGPDDDASVVLQRLYNKMTQYWERNGVDFQTLRLKKQFIYHIS